MNAAETNAAFGTTHWSVVLAAGKIATPGSREALASLCQAYWFPLYAHVRRRGHDAEIARDLTQGFFAELLARNAIDLADPQRGRLRTFLLAALDHFLHHAHRDAQALKRGGGREFISWDAQDAEQRLELQPADERSPDREFDRRWAVATLERARMTHSSLFTLDHDDKMPPFIESPDTGGMTKGLPGSWVVGNTQTEPTTLPPRRRA